jgi:Flp pilus assembly pilin Flp
MLSNARAALPRFVAGFELEDGQGLAEYGLIIAFVAIALILALGALALALIGILNVIMAALP